MSNLLQDGATWLGEQLKQSAGRSVVYVRGTGQSDPITGTLSHLQQEVLDEDGLGTGTFLNDWTFTATDLVVNATQIEPRSGDRILETLNGVDVAYEVLPPAPNRPVSEWADSSGILVIVHTKKVKR